MWPIKNPFIKSFSFLCSSNNKLEKFHKWKDMLITIKTIKHPEAALFLVAYDLSVVKCNGRSSSPLHLIWSTSSDKVDHSLLLEIFLLLDIQNTHFLICHHLIGHNFIYMIYMVIIYTSANITQKTNIILLTGTL